MFPPNHIDKPQLQAKKVHLYSTLDFFSFFSSQVICFVFKIWNLSWEKITIIVIFSENKFEKQQKPFAFSFPGKYY